MTNKPTYLLVYPVDPQSPAKFGGIESFTRDWLAYAPPEVDLALLGVDIMGRPEIGHWVEEAHHGRRYRFFPVCRMDAEGASNPGKTLFKTTTFRFIAGALRHLPAIRRGLGGGDAPVMVDLQRTEYLPIAWALGRPFVQTLHYSAAQNTGPMEGFRGKLSRLTEALDVAAFVTARQVNCVTTAQAEFYRQRHPILARWMKFDLLRPSVPADLFSRAPLPEPPVRFAFVGRLQEIKNPALLFAAFDRVLDRLPDAELHVFGCSDTGSWPVTDRVRRQLRLRGIVGRQQLGTELARMHVGLLTSHSENFPMCILEFLSVGRPVVLTDVGEMARIVTDHDAGVVAERSPEPFADAAVAVAQRLLAGGYDVDRLSAVVRPYRPAAALTHYLTSLEGAPVLAEV